MDFKKLNEKLEFIVEEAAMVESPIRKFENFYNYCLKNPNLKQKIYYTCFEGTIRIPSDTINHDWNEHKTTLEQWLDVLGSLKNIENAGLSKRKVIGRPMYLCRILAAGDFGVAFADCPKYMYIQTIFKSTIRGIDEWIKNGSVTLPTNNPSASSGNSNVDSSRFTEPNNIILYLKGKIKG